MRSAEALVRWRHPRLGLLYPGEFLPLAEQSGLIVDVTDFVLTDAIRQIGHWRQRGLDLGRRRESLAATGAGPGVPGPARRASSGNSK